MRVSCRFYVAPRSSWESFLSTSSRVSGRLSPVTSRYRLSLPSTVAVICALPGEICRHVNFTFFPSLRTAVHSSLSFQPPTPQSSVSSSPYVYGRGSARLGHRRRSGGVAFHPRNIRTQTTASSTTMTIAIYFMSASARNAANPKKTSIQNALDFSICAKTNLALALFRLGKKKHNVLHACVTEDRRACGATV